MDTRGARFRGHIGGEAGYAGERWINAREEARQQANAARGERGMKEGWNDRRLGHPIAILSLSLMVLIARYFIVGGLSAACTAAYILAYPIMRRDGHVDPDPGETLRGIVIIASVICVWCIILVAIAWAQMPANPADNTATHED